MSGQRITAQARAYSDDTPYRPSAAPSGVVIDRGVPIPQPTKRAGRAGVLPWRQMEIGDSFVFPALGDVTRTQQGASGHAAHFKPLKFTTRIVEENGKRVVRVWRIA